MRLSGNHPTGLESRSPCCTSGSRLTLMAAPSSGVTHQSNSSLIANDARMRRRVLSGDQVVVVAVLNVGWSWRASPPPDGTMNSLPEASCWRPAPSLIFLRPVLYDIHLPFGEKFGSKPPAASNVASPPSAGMT